MSGVNKAILVGHLGADPDVKTARSGEKIATFSCATSEAWRDKATGERKERTEWHRVVIFNEGLVKVAEQYLKKGAKVYIEGQIRTRKWTGQDNVERYSTEIVLSAFGAQLVMLDRAGKAPAPGADDYGTTKTGEASQPRPSAQDEMNDEIPF